MTDILTDDDNNLVQYPYSETDLIHDNTNVSFPRGPLSAEVRALFNLKAVDEGNRPPADVLEEGAPRYQGNQWVKTWTGRPFTRDEADSNAARALRDQRRADAALDKDLLKNDPGASQALNKRISEVLLDIDALVADDSVKDFLKQLAKVVVVNGRSAFD